jgi:tripartite-type tricarboxylate transporter receptor subunit TctC
VARSITKNAPDTNPRGMHMVKLSRRHFLQLAVAGVALPAVPRFAQAEAYPARPVHWMIGTLAGAGPDIVARIMGQRLSDRLGQQFVIENRPGGAGNTATEAVVRARADGYSLLFITSGNAINATLYDNLNYNFIRDIAPVASLIRGPLFMLVNPSLPAKTVPELIAYAKANPGKISMASAGNGTVSHVSGELFKMMAGVDMVHVPYRSGPPALTDLMGGQVQAAFVNLPDALEFVRTGKLRALAVTSATRWDGVPDIPSVGEFVPGYEASATFGVGVPKGTPTEIIESLNKEINLALADSQTKERFLDIGGAPVPLTPGGYGKLIADETEKWGKVVRAANIKVE